MNRPNPEAELSPRVADWLRSVGLKVYSEVPMGSTCIDLVGVDFDARRIVAVELKMSFSATVLRSVMVNQIVTSQSWAAAPTKPLARAKAFAFRYGIGLLRVGALGVSVICEPKCTKHVHIGTAANVLRFCDLDGPNDIGGIASMPGRGQAQYVHARIIQFLKGNPKATWQQIYERVANHYANTKSLQGSMRVVYNEGRVRMSIASIKRGAA